MDKPSAHPEGRDDALQELLVSNHRRFLTFLEDRVRSSADAEEILQAAFVKSAEKGDSLRASESALAWSYRLLRNAVIDFYRHRDAERRALEREALMSDDAIQPQELQGEICRCVRDLLPTIKADYGAMLEKVDLEGATIAEIAEELEITPNNARVRLHRARTALRKQLEVSCGTCATHGCLDCSCSQTTQAPEPV